MVTDGNLRTLPWLSVVTDERYHGYRWLLTYVTMVTDLVTNVGYHSYRWLLTYVTMVTGGNLGGLPWLPMVTNVGYHGKRWSLVTNVVTYVTMVTDGS